MRAGRSLALTALAAGLAGGDAPAQVSSAEEKAWTFAASAYTYIVPDDRDYVQPTFRADRDGIHLEARYNYEDVDTGSLWAGYTFGVGEKVTFEVTPMLGGVFGNTAGIAPGYEASLGWWKLELYTEGEYLFDANDSSDSFFYSWSELTLAPADALRFGLVVQRTKLYETDFDIQRGFLIGFSGERWDFTAHVFNPDESPPTVVLAVALSF